MTDTPYKPLLKALTSFNGNRWGERYFEPSIRLPRDPKRALADMQATLIDIEQQKKERGWG